MRELLSKYEFPGDKTRVVIGSALKALRARTRPGHEADPEACRGADAYIPTPKREIDKPFLMPVEDVFSISGGTVTGAWSAG